MKGDTGEACSTHLEFKNAYKIFVGKPEHLEDLDIGKGKKGKVVPVLN
jgi:hypothetical protein